MTTKTTTNSKDLLSELNATRLKYQQTRLEVKAGKNKNTNAHVAFKKTLAQLQTKLHLITKSPQS